MSVGSKVRHESGWEGVVTYIRGSAWGNRIITVRKDDGSEADWLECVLEEIP